MIVGSVIAIRDRDVRHHVRALAHARKPIQNGHVQWHAEWIAENIQRLCAGTAYHRAGLFVIAHSRRYTILRLASCEVVKRYLGVSNADRGRYQPESCQSHKTCCRFHILLLKKMTAWQAPHQVVLIRL